MDEYLDILDENGNETGEKRLRSEVHSQGLWHRTVHIYFYRKEEGKIELLVHLRSKNKDLKPNTWDTRFGGHLKSGQSIDQALIGEVKEETGLEIKRERLHDGPIIKRDKFPNREFTFAYFYEFTGDSNQLSFKDHEVQKVKWMDIEDIARAMVDYQDKWSPRAEHFGQIADFVKML